MAAQYAQRIVEHSHAPTGKPVSLGKELSQAQKAGRLLVPLHIPDARAAHEAAELIDRFGDFAADEAAARASRSRDLGNVIHYCRWRQIQRLIEYLGTGVQEATVH